MMDVLMLLALMCQQAFFPLSVVAEAPPLELVQDWDDNKDDLRNREKRSDEDEVTPPSHYIIPAEPPWNTSVLRINATHMNMTREIYKLWKQGSGKINHTAVIGITCLYSIIFITGVVGNVLVTMVISRNRNMHTATNYYLFSLAISDLLLLVLGVPHELSTLWKQYPYLWGEFYCRFRAFSSEMSNYSSILTIVAFSFERYFAVCRPFRSYQISTFKRASKIIFGIWVIAATASIPFAIHTKLHYINFPPNSTIRVKDSSFCAMLKCSLGSVPYYEISTTVFFIIPFFALVFIYYQILITMNERERNLMQQAVGKAQALKQQRSKRAIIRMLGSVVICFFFCWAPFHFQRIVYIYFEKGNSQVQLYIFLITGCCYYLESSLNPILYSLLSNKYRQGFKDILSCRAPTRRPTIARFLRNTNSRTVECSNTTEGVNFNSTDQQQPEQHIHKLPREGALPIQPLNLNTKESQAVLLSNGNITTTSLEKALEAGELPLAKTRNKPKAAIIGPPKRNSKETYI